MRRLALWALGASVVVAGTVMADAPAPSDKSAMTASKPSKAVNPTKLTCEDFLLYDDLTRPQIVFWSQGLTGKGKPEDAVIDVERTNTLVPILVEECKKEPHASYWKKMKEKFGIS